MIRSLAALSILALLTLAIPPNVAASASPPTLVEFRAYSPEAGRYLTPSEVDALVALSDLSAQLSDTLGEKIVLTHAENGEWSPDDLGLPGLDGADLSQPIGLVFLVIAIVMVVLLIVIFKVFTEFFPIVMTAAHDLCYAATDECPLA